MWVAAGLVFVVVAMLGALLLRPERQVVPEAPPVEAAAPVAPVAGPADAAALAGVSHLRLRLPEEVDAGRREALVAALKAGGVGEVQVEPLPFAVETSRVGFYLAADRAAAEAVAQLMGPLVVPDGALPVRDYGKLLDEPQPGRIDLWVGG